MRISFLVWDFFGGGAERVTTLLANGFKALGHEVEVVASVPTGPHRAALDPSIPVVEINPRPGIRLFWDFATHLIDSKPDVVFAQQTTRNVVAGIAALLMRCRGVSAPLIVGSEHGEIGPMCKGTKALKGKLYYQFARMRYPGVDLLVAISENVAASVRAWAHVPGQRLRVLPNPVIAPELDAQIEESLPSVISRTPGSALLLAVGRMESQKNFSLLLDAVALVRASRDVTLVILGEGSERPLLERKVAELGLSDRVQMPGFINNPYPVMAAADLLVLSSVWEGLPTVAIEAMYCGTPVVSTRNSAGINEILDDGRLGALVPKNDPSALATAILAVLDAPRRPADLKAHTRRYEIGNVSKLYLDTFETYLAARKARRATAPC